MKGKAIRLRKWRDSRIDSRIRLYVKLGIAPARKIALFAERQGGKR